MKEDDKHDDVLTEVITVKMINKDTKTNAPKVLPDKYSIVHTSKNVAPHTISHKHTNVQCSIKRDLKKTYKTKKNKDKKRKSKKKFKKD